MTPKTFQKKIYAHYTKEKRKLPWRATRDPYKILVSEVMLQQTQSSRVVGKYESFLKRFPSGRALARAHTHDVLSAWHGLGYNRRALALHKTAHIITSDYRGKFPKTYDELIKLPGVGPYTASALMVFAYNTPQVMIETNIRTVFIHFFFPKMKKVPDAKLLPLIERYADTTSPREWYNALMDYGAYLKATVVNPSRQSTTHVRQSAFKGSARQVRGAIIKAYVNNPSITKRTILQTLPYTKKVIEIQYENLRKENFFQ
jgi:A/G-specific adenine glycosylase